MAFERNERQRRVTASLSHLMDVDSTSIFEIHKCEKEEVPQQDRQNSGLCRIAGEKKGEDVKTVFGMGSTLARSLKFIFRFPPIHGIFDAGYGIVYIFGGLHEREIEDVIVHETLHYVLLRVAGKRASLKLDRIYTQVENDA